MGLRQAWAPCFVGNFMQWENSVSLVLELHAIAAAPKHLIQGMKSYPHKKQGGRLTRK